MTVVSRLKLDHPALGTAGGAGLHASIEAIYKKLGDNIADRILTAVDLDDAGTAVLEHNFKTDFANLRWDLYLYDEATTALTLITKSTSPSLSQFTVAANGSDPTTHVDLVNNSGAERDLALVLFCDPIKLDELTDVDVETVAPQDGQALVYEASTSKWKPGASGDSSFKLQELSGGDLVLKGGYLLLDTGEEMATHDGGPYASANFGVDQTLDLDAILGVALPGVETTYHLVIDRESFSAAEVQTDTGRSVIPIVAANYKLLSSIPNPIEGLNTQRYIPLGYVKTNAGGTSFTGGAVGTYAMRRHDTVASSFSQFERYTTQITTEVSDDYTHGLSGEPQIVALYYHDGSTKIGLDLSGHLINKTSTVLTISTLGLTFGSGQYVEVQAYRVPSFENVATAQKTFTSPWLTTASPTTLSHGLTDMEDIKAYTVIEWDTVAGTRRLIDPSALVVSFNATTFNLDWTGLDAARQYRVVAGNTPYVNSVPDGAFNTITNRAGDGAPSFPFPIASSSIAGITDGSSAAPGIIGEVIQVTGTITPNTGSFSVSSALPLTAGHWLVEFMFNCSNNSDASTTGVLINLSTGTSTAGQELIDAFSSNQFATNGIRGGGGSVTYLANLSGSQNYYGKALSYGANFVSAASYKLRAIRIR